MVLSDDDEELIVFCEIENTVIVNLLPDIDGTTGTIAGTSTDVHGTSKVDQNSSVFIGTKVITAPNEP